MAEESDTPVDQSESESNRELLRKMRERFKKALDADEEQRREAMDDIKFTNVPGHQWDENQKKERGKRPCYEFNKIRVTGKRIINNMRDNRPAGKVRGVEDADKDNAEIYEGLIRNIWNQSNGDSVIDYAAEYQVIGGMGAWRVTTGYNNDDAFEQDIMVEGIPNPFCLFSDPASKDVLKRDAGYWILTDKMANEAYKNKWPDAEEVSFESHEFDDDEEWEDEDEIRVCEYWYKEPVTKEILQLQDGKVIDGASDEAGLIDPAMIKNRRTVETEQIMMCIASGTAILEGPTKWEGKMFPFIPVYGEYYIIDGKIYWNGITRFSKDAQRSYNVSRTAITETIAMAPQAKYWATAKQAEGLEGSWKVAHQKNFPFLLYNPDPEANGPPTRMGGADVPVALIQEAQMASEEINMVTGIYQSDIGAPNAATSGRQELARQRQGAVATFNYEDNMSKAVERTWELLIDLIPQIYTTERSLRVLGADGAEDYVKINTIVPNERGEPVTVHDLSMGKYDVTVTTGPNFTTRRQESAETYQALLQSNPDLFGIIGDLIFKSMDLPYAEEISERLKVMLPPQIQETLNKDTQVPPEVQAMMEQAKGAMQMVEQQMQEVQAAAEEVKLEASANDTSKAEIATAVANLQTDQARFEAKVAKEVANLTKLESKLQIQAVENEKEGYIESERGEMNNAIANQMAEAVFAIQQLAAQFNNQAVEAMGVIEEKANTKPKIVRIDMVKKDGNTSAVPVYENDAG